MSSYYFDPRQVYSKRPVNTKKGQVIQKKPLDTPQYYSRSMVKKFCQFLNNNPSLNPWFTPYSYISYTLEYYDQEPHESDDFSIQFYPGANQDNWIHRTSDTYIRLPTLVSGNLLFAIQYNNNVTSFAIILYNATSVLSSNGFNVSGNQLKIPDQYMPITPSQTLEMEADIDKTPSGSINIVITLSITSGGTDSYLGLCTLTTVPPLNANIFALRSDPNSLQVISTSIAYNAMKDFEPDFNK